MAIALERTHGEIVDFRNGPKRDQRHCRKKPAYMGGADKYGRSGRASLGSPL
jgi:hypothetical protein